jgi:hypothetical protein
VTSANLEGIFKYRITLLLLLLFLYYVYSRRVELKKLLKQKKPSQKKKKEKKHIQGKLRNDEGRKECTEFYYENDPTTIKCPLPSSNTTKLDSRTKSQ